MRFELAVTSPFHLEATVRLLQRRPTHRVDLLEDGEWQRLLDTAGGALVRVRNLGSIDQPRLLATCDRPVADLPATLRRMLGLDADFSGFAALAEAVPGLGGLVAQLRGVRPPRFPTLFETFANVIPFQQVSLDSGAAIVARLVEALGARRDDRDRLRWAFPRAAAVLEAPLATLRRAGLSERKARALQAIAGSIVRGELSELQLGALTTAEAQDALRRLPGIGPWSAGLVLLRGLGRLDAFPEGDVGAARALARYAGGTTPRDVEAFARGFAPRQGLLYFCALGAQLLARGLITHATAERSAHGPGW